MEANLSVKILQNRPLILGRLDCFPNITTPRLRSPFIFRVGYLQRIRSIIFSSAVDGVASGLITTRQISRQSFHLIFQHALIHTQAIRDSQHP